jgi:hypothetical protein
MTHALADPVCDCPCACCQHLHTPAADRALAAATQVAAGVDPYPFLIPEHDIPLWQRQARDCALCGRTVRGPLLPLETSPGVMRMVGAGCFRKHTGLRRLAGGDDLLPLPLEENERA